MFAIPGFNVGNLVVEAPKEQLKKRKHESTAESTTPTLPTAAAADSSKASTAADSKTTKTTASSSAPPSSSASLSIAPSTSNAPFSKKFKKDPVFEKRPPSEPKLGWGWIPEPVPLKERASWNRSTKALRKAKAEEERLKKEKVISSISSPATAVDLLLQGSVDLKDIAGLGAKSKKTKGGDVTMQDKSAAASEQDTPSKKRNKRLERKIKRAAYIAAIESNKPAGQDTTTEAALDHEMVENSEEAGDVHTEEADDNKEESSDIKKKSKKIKQAPAPLHPEIAKLTNKERRLLKQFQKKQELEGVDFAATAVPELLHPVVTKAAEQPAAGSVDKKKHKKDTSAAASVSAQAPASSKKDAELSKKQQQLAKEREQLLAALNRTNNALAQLQTSLGDEEDATPLSKADAKSALQDKKDKKAKKGKDSKNDIAASDKEKQTPAPKESAPSTQSKQPKLTKLQEQMKKTLAGGKFRFLNEQLYTTTGEEAFELFQSKPELFDEYHEGFRSQVELWPQNPVDIFIAQLRQMPKSTVIADLGCGDAQIAQELTKHKVMSFDLVAKNERVTACDIAHLPLEDASVDVAIFCLSLMGTDFLKFLREAYRVLKPNGQLKISEVISRFTDVDAFVAALKALGFELRDSDSSNKMFIMFDFIKPDATQSTGVGKKSKKASKKQSVQEDSASLVDIDALDGSSLLKPCIYKKR
ncbi:25S rRNA (adenine645-N1)-methyltransferase [Dissophora globulifera]|uniref:Ribosomal RNA-processing protein 8 n=1 Tax=Dissophora globulifera TaxID=979702 RepID=A0A9P6RIT5_9FUNG|nr:25S rRNA (adenine645-N1)-methyltransferase [Dissophora globulifera]